MTTRVETGCLVFDSGKVACKGDPVKVANKQGLWRLADVLNDFDVEVIGPYFPTSPQRTQEMTRILKVVNIKEAPKGSSRQDVAMTVTLAALNNDAQRKRR